MAGMLLSQFALPVAMTSNNNEQLPPPLMLAPASEIELAPAAPAITGAPAQVEYALVGFANTMPLGSGSVRATLVSGRVLEFSNCTVTVDLPPEATLAGLKLLFAVSAEV
ncbi:hypothetical protein D3C81_1546220 [compost metagenome]